ncbi:DUF5666 domain-containing protein [Variovorax sp. M-6]|uniref:DUF5666 domain-containing protein n=1 Tax=Variovorax sp. M-6 TaxID=3233041 RepID=UPI003F99D2E4
MKTRPWLVSLTPLLIALLLSCGGGGGGSPVGGATSAQGADGASAAVPSSGNAGGDGTGATGGAASTGGSTSTASNGGDNSGVGSGGTGIGTADAATSVGAVDGMGSIIVNGLRYDIDQAVVTLADAATLQIGMTAKVTGPVDAAFANGVAKQVVSAVELRGAVSAIDPIGGSFVVLGTTVTIDETTVWADVPGLAGLVAGTTVQVWGLPSRPGVLRATRVEQAAANAAPVVTGTVEQLDRARGTFALGTLSVAYGSAAFAAGIDAGTLANGAIVRVRANTQAAAGLLDATSVENWYAIPKAGGTPIQLEGVIGNYTALGSFQLLGTTIDASAAQVTGGAAAKIGNGVTVAVGGTLVNGVLVATKLKIVHIPGGGALPSYTLIGTVGNFASPASFRVRGQPVDASRPGVVFVNGTQAGLANGTKVTVLGAQVVNGVLIATHVSFD